MYSILYFNFSSQISTSDYTPPHLQRTRMTCKRRNLAANSGFKFVVVACESLKKYNAIANWCCVLYAHCCGCWHEKKEHIFYGNIILLYSI